MTELLVVVLPVFLVIGAGYMAVWRGYFSMSGVDGLMKFTQRFAIPCLLFRGISTLDLGQTFQWALLSSFYAGGIACFILGMVGARYLFDRPWEDSVAIGFCCLYSNSLLLGLPISERAYGTESLSTNFAIIAVHSPVCYGIGIATMEIVRAPGAFGMKTILSILKTMFSNALIIGVSLGLVVNLVGIHLPAPITDGIDLLVRAALPAALFGLGGVLVQYRPEGDLRTIAMVVGISLVLHPVIVWLVGTWEGLSHDVLRSAVITAAMPGGVNTFLFADFYGRARRVAATSVLLGTGLTVITAWVWLQLLG